MDLSIRRNTIGNEDQSWLGSAHGTNAAQTITIDPAAFVKADHYPDGYLKSGLPLMKQGDGTYTLWVTSGVTPETNLLAGFLFTSTRVLSDPAVKVGAALYEHGRVKVDRLPVTVPEAAQATAAGRIIFA